MTKSLLCSMCVSLSLPLASVPAQTPTPHPAAKPPEAYPNSNPPLDGNYVLTVSAADKRNGPDFSILVAAQTFSISNAQPGATFGAQLLPQENGSFLMYYDLTPPGGLTIKSTVILHPGEPIQLLKIGDTVYNARMDRYPLPAAKGGG